MSTRQRIVGFVIALETAGLLLAATAVAQRQDASWKAALRLRGDVGYDNNPFLLNAGAKQELGSVSAADSQSGRFRDMESVNDVIPVTGVRAGLVGAGLFGRDLELSADVGYEANLRNTRRSHAELGLRVEQELSMGGRLRLEADWRPRYFWKNYLRDAVDANVDGTITPDERVYGPGTSREIDLTLEYRRRLVKARRSSPVEVTGELQVGYFSRAYDAPFAGRDRRGPGVGAELAAELGKRWTAGLAYSYQSLSADTSREVLILDETAFGVDFNGNGNASDIAARAVELVDRSRAEHNLELTVGTEVGRNATLELQYARRMRRFSSTQPYDVSDRDRRDTRNELGAELDLGVAHGLHLRFGGVFAKQNTNRSGDPGSSGEVADYSRAVVTAGLSY